MKRTSILLIGLMVMSGLALGMQNSIVSAQDANVLTFKVGAQTSDTLQNMIDDFNALDEYDFTVEIDEGTFETDSQFSGYTSRLSAGDDSFDVFAMDVIWPPALVENDWLVDLSDVFPQSEQDKFLQAPIEAGSVGDGIYGVPWFHDSGLLYYRTDILQAAADEGIIDDANPPETWEELKNMAIDITGDETIADTYGNTTLEGFVWQGNAYEGLMCDFMEILGGTGQTSWLEETDSGFEANLDTQNVKDSLSYMNSLIEEGASPEAVLTYNEEGSRAVWNDGDAVFHRNWPYAYALSLQSLALNGSAEGDDGEKNFAVAPMPAQTADIEDARTSCLGGWQLGINANIDDESVEDSKDFILWITEEEQQLAHFAGNGNLPTRSSAYDVDKLTNAGAGEQTYIVDFLPAFEKALPRPVHPDYPEMSESLWTPMQQAISGDITVDEATAQMQENVQAILDENVGFAPINPVYVFFGITFVALAVRSRRKD